MEYFVEAIDRHGNPVGFLPRRVAGYAVMRERPNCLPVCVHVYWGVKQRTNGMPISLYEANLLRDDLNAGIE